MEDKGDVLKYYRDFNRLSKPLLDVGRITIGKRNATFWRGFHPDDREALYERLIAKKPDMPRGRAFDYKDVFEIARAVFSGDNDFFLQEPPSRQREYECTRERRTERYGQDPQNSDRDECTPRHNWAHQPPSFDRLEDEEAPYPNEDEYEHPTRGRHHSSRVRT